MSAVLYNCAKCPGYCCSYPLIALDKRDVERLAKHHGMPFEAARRAFTKEADGRKYAGRWIATTVGRVLFNSIIPDEIGFLNQTFGKRELGDLVFQCFTDVGLARTTEFLDNLKFNECLPTDLAHEILRERLVNVEEIQATVSREVVEVAIGAA